MYLVTQGKKKINQLGYDEKTSEYVCFHNGKEVWREKGDTSLLNYFSAIKSNHSIIDYDFVMKDHIFQRYFESCK